MKMLQPSILLITVLLFPLVSEASIVIYNNGKSPAEQVQQGNPYGANNPYSITNNNNPYSTFRSAYEPGSVFNNNYYGYQAQGPQGGFQGTITQVLVNNPSAINNPYTTYGNPYNQNRPSYPYNVQNTNNPYSQFRSIYSPNSVYNNQNFQNTIQHPIGNQNSTY